MKNILGLDLGTNSIGWAVVNIPSEAESLPDRQGRIRGDGSRVIPMDAAQLGDFSKGNTVSQTRERTFRRSARRLQERSKLRRERLHRILRLMGRTSSNRFLLHVFPGCFLLGILVFLCYHHAITTWPEETTTIRLTLVRILSRLLSLLSKVF